MKRGQHQCTQSPPGRCAAMFVPHCMPCLYLCKLDQWYTACILDKRNGQVLECLQQLTGSCSSSGEPLRLRGADHCTKGVLWHIDKAQCMHHDNHTSVCEPMRGACQLHTLVVIRFCVNALMVCWRNIACSAGKCGFKSHPALHVSMSLSYVFQAGSMHICSCHARCASVHMHFYVCCWCMTKSCIAQIAHVD
jgi:hypothetical protein